MSNFYLGTTSTFHLREIIYILAATLAAKRMQKSIYFQGTIIIERITASNEQLLLEHMWQVLYAFVSMPDRVVRT